MIASAIGVLCKNMPKEDEYMTQALQELEAQLRDLNIKLAEAKQKEKQAALAAFKEQVELLGISQQEVLSALGYIVQRKRKAPAKYYDPTTGRSWSGRGPKPKWLEGKDLDALLVDRAAKTWWPGEDQD
ncbi:DNA-binding protein H-NS [Burkholderia dolosa AU0158]|nr:DNA-binding protein H-NS [Burkholderia dolosa AU0158]